MKHFLSIFCFVAKGFLVLLCPAKSLINSQISVSECSNHKSEVSLKQVVRLTPDKLWMKVRFRRRILSNGIHNEGRKATFVYLRKSSYKPVSRNPSNFISNFIHQSCCVSNLYIYHPKKNKYLKWNNALYEDNPIKNTICIIV